jgi:hypothetical protein
MELGTKKDHNEEMYILLGEPFPIIFQGVMAPGLGYVLLNTLSLQLLLNPIDEFDGTWYKERLHCIDVHIIRGALSNYY